MTQYGAFAKFQHANERDAALEMLREQHATDLARAAKVSEPIDMVTPNGMRTVALKWWIA